MLNLSLSITIVELKVDCGEHLIFDLMHLSSRKQLAFVVSILKLSGGTFLYECSRQSRIPLHDILHSSFSRLIGKLLFIST